MVPAARPGTSQLPTIFIELSWILGGQAELDDFFVFVFSAWLVIFFGVLLLVKLQNGIPQNAPSSESTF